MTVTSKLLTPTFHFSCSILNLLSSLCPWAFLAPPCLKLSSLVFHDSKSGSSLTSLTTSILTPLPSPTRRPPSPERPIFGHLLFRPSLGVHIHSYTCHHYVCASESQAGLSDSSRVPVSHLPWFTIGECMYIHAPLAKLNPPSPSTVWLVCLP